MASLNIQVSRMYRFDGESGRPLRAFVDITINDALLIKGIKVVTGRTGLFVSMPQEQSKDHRWYDTVRCLNDDIREEIEEVVMKAYHEDDVPEEDNEEVITY